MKKVRKTWENVVKNKKNCRKTGETSANFGRFSEDSR